MVVGAVRFRKYLPFLVELVKKDFKLKYKRSIWGVFWSVLQPLLLMVVMSIVFSALFRFDIENFALYLITGHLIFGFFSESTSSALSSIIESDNIIKKVSVPLYMLPLAKVITALVNIALTMIALVIVALATGAEPSFTMLLLPIPLLYTFVFSLGIGMILSTIMVFFRDIAYLYGILVSIIMYLTPIFYPISIIPDRYLFLINANPIKHFVQMFRNVVMFNTVPTFREHLICIAFCAFSIVVGVAVFRKKQHNFTLNI
jgi:ABC-type polysaccharide/polyol phosphate export permease